MSIITQGFNASADSEDSHLIAQISEQLKQDHPQFYAAIEGTWNEVYEVTYRMALAKGNSEEIKNRKNMAPSQNAAFMERFKLPKSQRMQM